ncbi:hypothetical protein APTSU1_001795200 [Apodemus speciosus]|uniref:Uncharacterized protein n=1 Tax=Apodemus speciosus TaxID=105296 RepID=A0ABQ0FU01_APOSI
MDHSRSFERKNTSYQSFRTNASLEEAKESCRNQEQRREQGPR